MVRRRALTWAVVLALLVAGLGGPAATSASAGGTGTVVVTALDRSTGLPVAGMGVFVVPYASSKAVASAATDASGVARVVVPAGSYRVLVWSNGSDHLPAWLWSPTPGTGTPVTVTAGTTTARTVRLWPSGTLRGVVTRDGVPQPRATVRVYSSTATTPVRELVTGPNGGWSTKAISGYYAVEVRDPAGALPPVWYPGALHRNDGRYAVVHVGEVVDVDVDLAGPAAAWIGGTVRLGGVPLAQATVLVRDPAGVRPDELLYTGADGTYRLPVEPGQHLVRASGTHIAAVWWPTAADHEAATAVAVAPGQEATVDLELFTVADVPVPPLVGPDGAPVVVVIGNSITQASTTAIHDRLGADHRLSVRGYAGATALEVLPLAERAAALDPDRVVVELGTNDVLMTTDSPEAIVADLVAVAGAFPGASCVAVTTVVITSAYGETAPRITELNELLRGLPALDPRFVVVDWEARAKLAAIDGLGPAISPDRVHPTERGEELLADAMADALATCPAPPPQAPEP